MSQFMPFPGYNPSASTSGEIPPLPCMGYVGRIESAVTEITANGSKRLNLTLDIAEGTFVNWFSKDLEARSGGIYAARHRGHFLLYYPKGDGSERDGWTINTFNRAINAIQKSNPGFDWDGTDNALIGKSVGFVVREAEWNGHVFIEIGKLLTVDAIRNNNYKLMPRRVPKSEGNPQPTTTNNQVPGIPPGFTQVEADQDLPF